MADGHVSLADQCRLLFLSHSGSHDQVPVCPWRPFGATPLADTDIEIRAHANCRGHALRYQGLFWDCAEDEKAAQSASTSDTSPQLNGPRRPQPNNENQAQPPVFYGNLNRQRESASENATRDIFGWLRVEGYAPYEKRIWEHGWFEILESDDEDEGQGDVESCTSRSYPRVESWISDVCRRSRKRAWKPI